MRMRFPWVTAGKIAAREVRSAAGRFAFVVLAVALGVGALTGVRSFSQAFRAMLSSQARTLLAGDIIARVGATSTPAQMKALQVLGRRQGVRWTRITESVSMVAALPRRPDGDPILTSLKAVDPRQYPFDGTVETTPPGALARLDDASVLASPDLLLRAGLGVGAELSVGGEPFRILGVLRSEPDRLEGGLAIGPRLLLTAGGLRRTGIIQLGSQVQSRLVFKLASRTAPLAPVEDALAATFSGVQIRDYHNANPTVQRGLERSTLFLSLISLIALVIGGLGVASAMHAHLQLRLDSIATMKVLGARNSQILRIYGLQTLLLGAVGGGLGIGLSAAVEQVFPHLLARYFPAMPPLQWSWGPMVEGLGAGLLITLLSTLPILLGVRKIAPAALLRRHMADHDGRGPQRAYGARPAYAPTGLGAHFAPAQLARRWGRAAPPLLAGTVLLAGVAGLAATLADQPWHSALLIGGYFLLALATSIAVLAAATWALLKLLRILVHGWPRHAGMPIALRQGVANLYRPGSQTLPALLALGIGVMFTLSVFLLQRVLLRDVQRDTPPGVANVFLIDIPAHQAEAVLAFLHRQPGLESAPELVHTVAARLHTVNGELPLESSDEDLRALARRRDFSISPIAAPPTGIALTQGKWWIHADRGHPQLAVSEDLANALQLDIGDEMQWTAGETAFSAPVAAIYQAEPQRLIARVDVMLSPGPLASLPENVNGGVRVNPAQIPELERALFDRFPTITVINLADVVERVQEVVSQITLVVHFVSFFAVLAGAVILASSVAGTRFRRMREIAVLKTLGATRGRIARIFSTEFLLLGTVAGACGSLLAIGFTGLIARRLLHLPFHPDLAPCLVAVAATATIAVAAGWLACARILALKPLEVLRGE